MTGHAEGVRRLEALLTPLGREVLGRLGRETVTPETALRVGTLLRAEYPAELVRDALAQHELRERARVKFSRAGEMFFTRDGLEQASAEVVARHRATRYRGFAFVADLCCGVGGDLVALAAHGPVLGVDRDPVHLRMAQVNAAVYGVSEVNVLESDVRVVGLTGVDAAFIDPARRSGQRRLRTGDSEPPLDWCLSLADRVGAVGIKAAPGLDRGAIPVGWELEFVAVGRELKEAVAWSPALATTTRRATVLPSDLPPSLPAADPADLPSGRPAADPADPPPGRPAADPADLPSGRPAADPADPPPGRPAADSADLPSGRPAAGPAGGHTLTGAADDAGPGWAAADPADRPAGEAAEMTGRVAASSGVEVRAPGEFLLDPNPAVTRAGLVQKLARLTGTWKIDEQIAFLSADVAVHTPFARTLRVIDSAPWDQKRLPARLRALDIGAVDIRRRGLAGDVTQLHRQLRLSGSRRAILVMTRAANRPWALICVDEPHV